MALKAEYREELAELAQSIVGDLSLSQVAYKTGVSYETIRKFVRFGHVPSESMLERIAEGLGADINLLRKAAGYAVELPSDPVKRVQIALNGIGLDDFAKERIIELLNKHPKKD